MFDVRPPLSSAVFCLALLLAQSAVADDQDSSAAAPPQAMALHLQSTLIVQGHPAFHSPYDGANSLGPAAQGRETFDFTVYGGFRPWAGAEIWINPEVDQGFGLSNTEGVAGYLNGEGAKVGRVRPYVKLHRLFLRQTIDLGGKAKAVDADLNQLAGSETENRLVLWLGEMTATDVFDTNSLAHDPRHDFLNWALIDTGTFDYAADAWGYTIGAAAEWYQGDWTLRLGAYDLSNIPNSEKLEPGADEFQLIGEVERRFNIAGHDGAARLTGFLSRGRMGRYDDALALARATGTTPSTAAVRRYQSRSGLSFNAEQSLTKTVGIFVRAGFAGGQVEPYEYADIDRTVAAGISIKGEAWGEKDDTFALAGIDNAISAEHIAYLAAGGLGILVGDGRLPHPGDEHILETYYDHALGKVVHATLDYQFVDNPAYNRDRGPVHVFALRLHAQY